MSERILRITYPKLGMSAVRTSETIGKSVNLHIRMIKTNHN